MDETIKFVDDAPHGECGWDSREGSPLVDTARSSTSDAAARRSYNKQMLDTGATCSAEVDIVVSAGVIPLAPFDSLVTGSCRREAPESRMSRDDHVKPRPCLLPLRKPSFLPQLCPKKAESQVCLGDSLSMNILVRFYRI